MTPEQQAIIDGARALAGELRASMRTSEKEGVSRTLVDRWRGLDYLRMDWPEQHGGFGLARGDKLLALESLACGDAAATLMLDRASWVCSPLLQISAVADRVAERLGGDVGAHVDIDQRGDGVIHGLPASCDTLFSLKGHTLACFSDVSVTPREAGALHALGHSEAHIDGASLWQVDLGADDASRLLGGWQLYLAAVLVGLADAAAKQTRQFCLERVTFGRKVAHHQAVAFLIADMEIAIAAARELVRHAADCGAARVMHAAFIEASECALFVTNYAVQLHGSHGYVEDYPVEKWMREARAISLMLGGCDAAREYLADAIDAEIES